MARDLRGRLRVPARVFRRFCRAWRAEARRSHRSRWIAGRGRAVGPESGSRATLQANFAATRQSLRRARGHPDRFAKTIGPFYSAASAKSASPRGAEPVTVLLAMLDRAHAVFDAWLDPLGAIARGAATSAGTEASCGGGSQVLATRPGDAGRARCHPGLRHGETRRPPTHGTGGVRRPGDGALGPRAQPRPWRWCEIALTGRYAAYVITGGLRPVTQCHILSPVSGIPRNFAGRVPWSARPLTSAAGRRGRRPRTRGSAPQFMQVFGRG